MTSGDIAVELKDRVETCARVLVQGVDPADAAKVLELGPGPLKAAQRLTEIWKTGKAASAVVSWVDDPTTSKPVFKVSIRLGGGMLEDLPTPGAKAPLACASCGGLAQHAADCPTETAKRSP